MNTSVTWKSSLDEVVAIGLTRCLMASYLGGVKYRPLTMCHSNGLVSEKSQGSCTLTETSGKQDAKRRLRSALYRDFVVKIRRWN